MYTNKVWKYFLLKVCRNWSKKIQHTYLCLVHEVWKMKVTIFVLAWRKKSKHTPKPYTQLMLSINCLFLLMRVCLKANMVLLFCITIHQTRIRDRMTSEKFKKMDLLGDHAIHTSWLLARHAFTKTHQALQPYVENNIKFNNDNSLQFICILYLRAKLKSTWNND